MQFIKSGGPAEGIKALSERLTSELDSGHSVLWLVSGGSNVAASTDAMQHIDQRLTNKLKILLVDERYGSEGHNDSNWSQLMRAGFQPKLAETFPVLNDNLSFEITLDRYKQLAAANINSASMVIAQLGIGADGHIAGILPNSPAASESKELVAGYDGGQYQRLTLTFPALRKIDAVYAFAFGEEKRESLNTLRNYDVAQAVQPAQVLKEIKEVYLYNDQVGGGL
jgi:6-phosphogluconolactonase/glucosamine-6-phosphate isomerase/deaminase